MDTSSGVTISRMREQQGARRLLTILENANSRGVKVLGSIMKGKVIEIEGTIKGTSESDYIAKVQGFVEGMMNEMGSIPIGDMVISNSVGTYVYEDCVLLNPEELIEMEEHYNITFNKFRAVFLATKGFARDQAVTEVSYDNITSSPYSDTITIGGNAQPEPVIAITFDLASTIDEFTFTNTTTNTSITLDSLSLADDDIVYIDIANKEVRKNTTKVNFSGVFPIFLPGDNDWQLAVSGSDNITEEQTSYDDVVSIYGNNWVAQSFQTGSTEDITQLATFLKKIDLPALQLYDDFSSGSTPQSSHWTKNSGTWDISSGQMRLRGNNGTSSENTTADTNDKTGTTPAGEPLTGEVEFYMAHVGGTHGSGGNCKARITNGTDYISIDVLVDVNDMIVRLGGHYGSGDGSRWTASSGTISIKQVGSNIEIRHNGSLKQTLSGKSFQANTYFWGQMQTNSPGSTNHYLHIDNVYFQGSSNANTDIDVRIETDSSGDPSGTAVTDGTTTIPASSVGSSFSEIIAAFATAPSLTASTTYHLLFKQSGGDTNNYYQLRKNTAGGYASGELQTTSDGGSAWTNVTGQDLYFKLWTTLPSSINIDIVISYFKSWFNIV